MREIMLELHVCARACFRFGGNTPKLSVAKSFVAEDPAKKNCCLRADRSTSSHQTRGRPAVELLDPTYQNATKKGPVR